MGGLDPSTALNSCDHRQGGKVLGPACTVESGSSCKVTKGKKINNISSNNQLGGHTWSHPNSAKMALRAC